MLLMAGIAAVSPAVAAGFEPIGAAEQVGAMGRGVNVMGYDPQGWKDPSKAKFKDWMFKQIRLAGFSNVRIVLQAFDLMDGENRLPDWWLGRLDDMVQAALDAGLTVVLDEHDFTFCGKHADACREKLDAFWSQVAPHFRDAPNRVLFEILNEPHGDMTPERWNVQLAETLAIIRASNPARNVVIGPGSWNGLEQLPALRLPDDDAHIIVTVHYYHPMAFTHRGASWVEATKNLHDIHWGSANDLALMQSELDRVKAWSVATGRPIFLGEFGAFDPGPLPDRVSWTAAVARGAEARGFAWAYWYFDGGFGVFDVDQCRWIEPILGALIPQ